MKKLLLPLAVLALLSFTVTDNNLTREERNTASKSLKETQERVTSTIKGLSTAQLNFKPTPESWSVAECLEHITISEYSIFEMLQGTLQSEADPSRRGEVTLSDEQLIVVVTDRSNKVKTQEPFEPTGKYGSVEETLESFLTKRKSNIRFVMNTQDDLRNRYQQFPFGLADSYQILLLISAHTERHVAQMEEVMSHDTFPKE